MIFDKAPNELEAFSFHVVIGNGLYIKSSYYSLIKNKYIDQSTFLHFISGFTSYQTKISPLAHEEGKHMVFFVSQRHFTLLMKAEFVTHL